MRHPTRHIATGAAILSTAALAFISCHDEIGVRGDPAASTPAHDASFEAQLSPATMALGAAERPGPRPAADGGVAEEAPEQLSASALLASEVRAALEQVLDRGDEEVLVLVDGADVTLAGTVSDSDDVGRAVAAAYAAGAASVHSTLDLVE
jgi:hypothetical protein